MCVCVCYDTYIVTRACNKTGLLQNSQCMGKKKPYLINSESAHELVIFKIRTLNWGPPLKRRRTFSIKTLLLRAIYII